MIAIIAWGSLIWRPTHRGHTLRLRIPCEWYSDGPRLPVEFARISKEDELTLVVLEEYPVWTQTLWSWSGFDELAPAIENLAGREGITDPPMVHGVTADGGLIGGAYTTVAENVLGWLADRDADAAIWTGLPPGTRGWARRGYEGFSVPNALDYWNACGAIPTTKPSSTCARLPPRSKRRSGRRRAG